MLKACRISLGFSASTLLLGSCASTGIESNADILRSPRKDTLQISKSEFEDVTYIISNHATGDIIGKCEGACRIKLANAELFDVTVEHNGKTYNFVEIPSNDMLKVFGFTFMPEHKIENPEYTLPPFPVFLAIPLMPYKADHSGECDVSFQLGTQGYATSVQVNNCTRYFFETPSRHVYDLTRYDLPESETSNIYEKTYNSSVTYQLYNEFGNLLVEPY